MRNAILLRMALVFSLLKILISSSLSKYPEGLKNPSGTGMYGDVVKNISLTGQVSKNVIVSVSASATRQRSQYVRLEVQPRLRLSLSLRPTRSKVSALVTVLSMSKQPQHCVSPFVRLAGASVIAFIVLVSVCADQQVFAWSESLASCRPIPRRLSLPIAVVHRVHENLLRYPLQIPVLS